MAYDFRGKKALVTGGGRGIGKAIVEHLIKCKAEVIALDVNEENLNVLKREIPSVKTVCVDLSDWTTARKAVEELGLIHFLVNNAAIAKLGSFEEITEEDIDSLFAVDVKPIINISQVVIKELKKHKIPGSIVNISSETSEMYVPKLAAYSVCKAAVDKLTKTMATELASYEIRVNAINPTLVRTEMSGSMMDEKFCKEFINGIPLRRRAERGDVAAAVLFLLSEQANMITGTCLYVDGGHRVA